MNLISIKEILGLQSTYPVGTLFINNADGTVSAPRGEVYVLDETFFTLFDPSVPKFRTTFWSISNDFKPMEVMNDGSEEVKTLIAKKLFWFDEIATQKAIDVLAQAPKTS